MSRNQLPTVGELQNLTAAFRRDPASSFVRLGGCLLELGRPQEAVDVATSGLRANPGDLEGRLLLGTALSQLHRWKDAQTELLKVVKADRNNGRGFRLLGEVLMRRSDFERALPVLQHAQNLNPSDSQLLALVRRARDGHPLDPPPPLPMAMQPVQDGRGSASAASGSIGAMPAAGGPPPAPALGRVELQQREIRTSGPAPAAHRVAPRVENDRRSNDQIAFGAIQHHVAPPPEDPLAPMGQAPRSGRSSAPPPPPGASAAMPVRPRVIPAEKPKDAAQAGLRTSAAAGEQYLNQLLVGGLLDVPNVRVSEAQYDVIAGKRWGRSSLRMFIYLFVVLIAAGTGSGVWYWYSEKQRSTDIARYLDGAGQILESGDRVDLANATEQAKKALERDTSDVYSMAVLAETTSLSTLLYGEYSPAEVQRGVDSVARSVKDPSARGYRELVIAQAAMGLAQLADVAGDADADERLAKIRAHVKDWLERSPDDHLARWLLGRAHLAAGDREGAFAALTMAHANGEGPAIATVDLANYHIDQGEYETGMALFESALSRSPSHPLAFVGRSLARSERRVEAQEAMADISIGLAQAKGSRLLAWKALALASAQAALEDYSASNTALKEAEGPDEPRFLARVGLARIAQGRIVDAAKIRGQIRWYAADPDSHPLVKALDAELLLARGLPSEALGEIGDMTGVRAAGLRGRALFDLGRSEDALEAFEKALAAAPENLETKVWVEATRMMSTAGDSRRVADETLDSLGRKATTKTARFVHGTALAAVGNVALAKDKLELSVTDLSEAFPNPLAYRSHLALAKLAFAAGNATEASAQLDMASEINPGYLPTLDLRGQVLVDTDPEKALRALQDVINAGVASSEAELAYARALVKTGGDKDQARDAIRRAKERGATGAVLQKAILEVDPALFEELSVAAPAPQ